MEKFAKLGFLASGDIINTNEESVKCMKALILRAITLFEEEGLQTIHQKRERFGLFVYGEHWCKASANDEEMTNIANVDILQERRATLIADGSYFHKVPPIQQISINWMCDVYPELDKDLELGGRVGEEKDTYSEIHQKFYWETAPLRALY